MIQRKAKAASNPPATVGQDPPTIGEPRVHLQAVGNRFVLFGASPMPPDQNRVDEHAGQSRITQQTMDRDRDVSGTAIITDVEVMSKRMPSVSAVKMNVVSTRCLCSAKKKTV